MRKANLTALLTAALLVAYAAAYTNHTVGGDKGWFFDATTNSSATNYTSWAANQTFSLGDYLIFNTNTNQSVIQTYNATTYRNCSVDDAEDDDTFQYGGGGERFGEALIVAVPLTITGKNYYFSSHGGDGGVQCRHGMAFEIDVARGAGLPPSLNQPPPPPYMEPPGPGSAQSPPGVVVAAQPSAGVGADLRGGSSALLLLLPLLLF